MTKEIKQLKNKFEALDKVIKVTIKDYNNAIKDISESDSNILTITTLQVKLDELIREAKAMEKEIDLAMAKETVNQTLTQSKLTSIIRGLF